MDNKLLINKSINLKIRLYQCVIIYAKNCTLHIRENNSGQEFIINQGDIAFLERNLNFRVSIVKTDEDEPYQMYALTKETLRKLLNILEPTMKFPSKVEKKTRVLEDKVHTIQGNDINHSIFNSFITTGCKNIYYIASLLYKEDNANNIFLSLYISSSHYFTDQVRKIIETDLSKKWNLSILSDSLNFSEVTIRKKLEAEKTSFNQVLLDVRMQKAVKLLLDKNYHVNRVSEHIGMTSTSYFIKTFSSYYGVTPKQFYLYYKGIKSDTT